MHRVRLAQRDGSNPGIEVLAERRHHLIRAFEDPERRFIPESPRWLYVNHKREKAVAVLAKYHGYGNEDSAWVKLQLEEYEAFLNM